MSRIVGLKIGEYYCWEATTFNPVILKNEKTKLYFKVIQKQGPDYILLTKKGKINSRELKVPKYITVIESTPKLKGILEVGE